MTDSTMPFRCGQCSEMIGSFDIPSISLISAENLIQFLVRNSITMVCNKCQKCNHEFEYGGVKVRATNGLDENIAEKLK